MSIPRRHFGSGSVVLLILSFSAFLGNGLAKEETVTVTSYNNLDHDLKTYVDNILGVDNYTIIPGVTVRRNFNVTSLSDDKDTLSMQNENDISGRSLSNFEDYFYKRLENYAKTHVVSVYLPETARFLIPAESGKSSFLAGFGMGFLTFALKKLLLPVFLGAQIIKSVLIALFLPSLIGSVGKLLGKGLSTVSGISGASGLGQHNNNQVIEDFDFKDTNPYANDNQLQDVNMDNAEAYSDVVSSTLTPEAANRLGMVQRVAYVPQRSENYYMRMPTKKTDFKVFHKIPSSTLLLATYDPFYSPLLSRLDTVFQQLGLGSDKSPETERCRERLVCMMYANPAKYAPYSNLVSAQLSRELNELKKPSTDNPEILRFFRYMKAARDGQDGEECLAHIGCPSLEAGEGRPALLTTYNEINKLVQARKI